MLTGNNITLKNGLHISIDWLSWTLKEPCSVSDVFLMLGYSQSDFISVPYGRFGYHSQLKHNAYSISILYDGLDGMGVHVDVSGSAMADMLAHFADSRISACPFGGSAYETESFDFSVLCDLLKCIRRSGNVTRCDIAIDDIGAKYFTISELREYLDSGLYVSKFRTWIEQNKKNRHEYTGRTIYLGSRKSDIMLRVYDKQLEQNGKVLISESDIVMYPWVRWEFELKKERANAVVDQLLSGTALSDIALGVLSNYLRLIVADNARVDRCSVSEKWLAFLDGISKIILVVPAAVKTLEKAKAWFLKYCAPTLASIIIADGGSTDFVDNALDYGATRIKGYQYDMIQSALGGAI